MNLTGPAKGAGLLGYTWLALDVLDWDIGKDDSTRWKAADAKNPDYNSRYRLNDGGGGLRF
jgi:hypothetical protein